MYCIVSVSCNACEDLMIWYTQGKYNGRLFMGLKTDHTEPELKSMKYANFVGKSFTHPQVWHVCGQPQHNSEIPSMY